MTQNYIGINGLVTQDLSSIQTELVNVFKNIYSQSANLEQNSPDGQWLNIMAQEKKDILDLVATYYNNLDVDRVVGIPQQILYKLNGLTINAYTYSFVYVTVVISTNVNLQGLDENIESSEGTGYTVRDGNGNRWILAESQELTPGSYTLNFRAAELGGITALPNTVNIMETVIKGVTSVNNPAANYITGNQGETSAQFRRRRNQAMSVPSQGFDESIESQLLSLSDVSQCKVYSNRTAATVSGIPAHGVWVIVEGGTSEEIGRIIYNNVPPGIPMKGAQSAVITKLNGQTETVYYDLPSPLTLYIRADYSQFDSVIDTTYVINQLVSRLDYNIGERAESANITTILKEIIADMGTIYNVEISTDQTNWYEYLVPGGLNQFFNVTTSSVTLSIGSST